MKSLIDQTIEDMAENYEISKEEATQKFLKQSEHVVDMTKLPKQEHEWHDRGLKFTCESPTHPPHEAWKRRSPIA